MASHPTMTLLLISTLAAYLLGSLSFAVIVSRVMGLNDPRSYGSKNPGATNVLRSGNKTAAIATLVLDAAKGWLPLGLLGFWGAGTGPAESWGLTVALVGLAAFLGHLYPVFFGFKGGKGVATAAGVLLGFGNLLGLAVALVWLGVAAVFRYSSLSALLAALLAPPIYWALASQGLIDSHTEVLCAIGVMSALLIYRHQANITRLFRGEETRIGQRSKS